MVRLRAWRRGGGGRTLGAMAHSDGGSRRRSAAFEPVERAQTVREAIAEALREDALTTQELSARVSVPEREVADHLEHLGRSLRRGPEHLVVIPARCVRCGFVFEARERRTKPSRCPACKSERLAPARFSIGGSSGSV